MTAAAVPATAGISNVFQDPTTQNLQGANGLIGIPSLSRGYSSQVAPLPKFRYALTQVAAGVRNAKILCAGDSINAGLWANGAGSGSGYDGGRPLSWPNVLAAALPPGYPTYVGNTFGSAENAGLIANFKLYDTRWTFDANWSCNSGFLLAGGCVFTTAVNGATATFTPTAAYDSVDLYYIATATTGTLSWQLGSGAVTNIVTTNATNQMVRVRLTGSLAQQTLTIKCVGTTAIFIHGVSTFNGAIKGIEVLNAGGGGYKSADWANATQAWSPSYVSGTLGTAAQIAPDLTIINLGPNDWSNAVTPSTFTSNMQTVINAYKLVSDVAIMTSVPQSATVTSLATQLGIVTAARQVAQQNGCLLIESNGLFGDYAFAQSTLGYYNPANDVTHPGSTGYSALGKFVGTILGA